MDYLSRDLLNRWGFQEYIDQFRELCEEWALAECEGESWWKESKESTKESDVKYAGAVPVERAASAPATALAVRSALHTTKNGNKNFQKVTLDISPKGIVVTDTDSNDNVLNVSIYRISYCSADAANARVFAVVEGKVGANPNGVGDTHVAHVFVCTRRRQARALALALAHAFNDAYQAWQANQAGSAHRGSGKRLAPWVKFHEETDEDIESDQWEDNQISPAPLVSFG